MATPKNTLKSWFKNLLKPTQEQFWAWMDSYWHKEEAIPMGKVQGLERLLQGTATVESVEAKADKTHTHAIADVSGLPEELENKADHHHGHPEYVTWESFNDKADNDHTHPDLATKNELTNKVDKVTGKQLSTEDFTSFEKTKLAGLQNYQLPPVLSQITEQDKGRWNDAYRNMPDSLTVTGSATKRITLTLYGGETIETYFTDEQGVPVDVQLNSISFDKNTGVFSAVNSDGQTITANFDGRYALVTHNHTIAQVDGLQTALNAKAPTNHTHTIAQVTGLQATLDTKAPTSHNHPDLATKTELSGKANINHTHPDLATKTDFYNIQIGGRNLLQKSGITVTNSNYVVQRYICTDEIKIGETITLSVKADLAHGCSLALYNSDGDGSKGVISIGLGENFKTMVWNNNSNAPIAKGQQMYLFAIGNNSGTKTNTVNWIKLERGNKPTDWSPAPEDLATEGYVSEIPALFENRGYGANVNNSMQWINGPLPAGHTMGNLTSLTGFFVSFGNTGQKHRGQMIISKGRLLTRGVYGDNDNSDWDEWASKESVTKAVAVTANIALNSAHSGRIIVCKNITAITINLSLLTDLDNISVIKTGAGNVTFIGNTIVGETAITGSVGSTASIVVSGTTAFINVNNR